jgi:hypothetical protein
MIIPTDNLIRNITQFSSSVPTPNHFSTFRVTLNNTGTYHSMLSHGVYSQIPIVSGSMTLANTEMPLLHCTDQSTYILSRFWRPDTASVLTIGFMELLYVVTARNYSILAHTRDTPNVEGQVPDFILEEQRGRAISPGIGVLDHRLLPFSEL